LIQILYVGTGVASTLLVQALQYQGAADPRTLFTLLAHVAGSTLILLYKLFVKKHEESLFDSKTFKTASRIGFVEVVGYFFSFLGVQYAGSGVYQIIYSSIVIFVAVMSRIFLGKKVNFTQWGGIIIVFIGLVLSTMGSKASGSSSVSIGILYTLVQTFLFATNYVSVEHVLKQDDAPNKEKLQMQVGVTATILVVAYILIFASQNMDQLFYQKIKQNNGDYFHIGIYYILLTASGFLHSWTYYIMLGSVGSISTGLSQSIRAISVFLFSSLFFCEVNEAQCITLWKGISSIIVVGGVLFYSTAPDFFQSDKKEVQDEVNQV
jgi:drug/metabolite transporter (DMT)-like permease